MQPANEWLLANELHLLQSARFARVNHELTCHFIKPLENWFYRCPVDIFEKCIIFPKYKRSIDQCLIYW